MPPENVGSAMGKKIAKIVFSVSVFFIYDYSVSDGQSVSVVS